MTEQQFSIIIDDFSSYLDVVSEHAEQDDHLSTYAIGLSRQKEDRISPIDKFDRLLCLHYQDRERPVYHFSYVNLNE